MLPGVVVVARKSSLHTMDVVLPKTGKFLKEGEHQPERSQETKTIIRKLT